MARQRMRKARCRYCRKPCRPAKDGPKWDFCARYAQCIDLDEKGNMVIMPWVRIKEQDD